MLDAGILIVINKHLELQQI